MSPALLKNCEPSSMAAFSYNKQQHQPFLVDSTHMIPTFLPHDQFEEMSNSTSSSLLYYQIPDGNSTLDCATKDLAAVDNQMGCSSSLVEPHGHGGVWVSKQEAPMEIKKRKNKDGSCLSSVQSKGTTKESKSKKQKQPKTESDEKKEKRKHSEEEAPIGYIHVRARRGEATDSHSLAERVRREKISERMKILQGLVPGCDKVTGKALMLDEIINYVQSLQNQVEFLSMKLASMSPVLYDFGVDFDGQMNQLEDVDWSSGVTFQKLGSLLQESQLAQKIIPFQSRACEETSSPFLLQEQGSIAFSESTHELQDTGSYLVPVGEQTHGFMNQVLLDNKCSFQ